jgi:hypothetical protein
MQPDGHEENPTSRNSPTTMIIGIIWPLLEGPEPPLQTSVFWVVTPVLLWREICKILQWFFCTFHAEIMDDWQSYPTSPHIYQATLMTYSPLTKEQIGRLQLQSCTANNWENVSLAAGCDVSRIHNVHFLGSVRIGENSGTVTWHDVALPCGLYNATIADCVIGNNVRIATVRVMLARYTIEDNAIIQDIGTMVTTDHAHFGNGQSIDVVNEAGGRGTLMFNRITAQVAYLMAMRRHDQALTEKLRAFITEEISGTQPIQGIVGQSARVVGCGTLIDVVVGPHACVSDAMHLENGTICSCEEQPTIVGAGVQAHSFVIAEGARVDSGAMIDKVYVGQGVKMGKQFSAENCLFFANCEAFHGEAASVFAGPYTVTHHKSTLLIAGLFSFYNAGSGTNQSNHMYKLGPVHQGIFERGSKTGSFSYVLYESQIGAFSVVIGKHLTNINIPHLPFSSILEKGGESFLVPAINLFSIGTQRDGEKWPKRDNRKMKEKRDLIIFDVFSPYVVEKMRRGRAELQALNESTSKDRATVLIGGVQMNRVLLRKGARYYDTAITRYLTQKVLSRLADPLSRVSQWKAAVSTLRPITNLKRPDEWTDLSGLLAPREAIVGLEEQVRAGTIHDYQQLLDALKLIYDRYAEFEWQYVCAAFEQEKGIHPSALTKDRALALTDEWQKASLSIHSSILEDAKKEFGGYAKIGYGLDLQEGQLDADFAVVRGTLERNAIVQKLTREVNEITQQANEYRKLINGAV